MLPDTLPPDPPVRVFLELHDLRHVLIVPPLLLLEVLVRFGYRDLLATGPLAQSVSPPHVRAADGNRVAFPRLEGAALHLLQLEETHDHFLSQIELK